ncbi:Platelet glycoprotein 4 [Holothuria leucospilota]|uniref:Platelet glycoprotein 4 n=1 Tax=Holothuria leucospilota TaxID=206669 RepID=A0A9Q1BLD5_HOLLE|nr:Platelet glycoprotein 4 [Holothuria leucospilota]
MKKVDVVQNSNGTNSYKKASTYVFDRDLSIGPETDTFTTVNMVAFTLASFIKYGGRIPQSAVELIHELASADLVLELSVKDILWGYQDAYLKLFQDVLGEGTIPSTEFGIYVGRNATPGETWTVFNGVDNTFSLNTVNVYGGMESLPWWSTEYANMINGTDGALFHPYVQEDEFLYVFVPDICRAGYLLFDKNIKVKGIPVGEWYVPKELYANPSEVPDNIGFCTPDKYSCPPTGLLNVTECFDGAPIFFSSPHFLYGENLLDTVEGLNPVEDEHKIYFALEMLTGVPFKVDNRVQINIRVDPYDFLPNSENIQGLYMPVLWLNQSTVIDDENADLFMHDVIMPQRLLYSFTYIFFGIGGGLFFGSIIVLIRSMPKKTKVDEEFLKDSVRYSGTKVEDENPTGLYEPGM